MQDTTPNEKPDSNQKSAVFGSLLYEYHNNGYGRLPPGFAVNNKDVFGVEIR